jgi:hypothetical protein
MIERLRTRSVDVRPQDQLREGYENHSNKSGTKLKAKKKYVDNQHLKKVEERPLEALFMVRIHAR